jgi:hypothetical protein
VTSYLAHYELWPSGGGLSAAAREPAEPSSASRQLSALAPQSRYGTFLTVTVAAEFAKELPPALAAVTVTIKLCPMSAETGS